MKGPLVLTMIILLSLTGIYVAPTILPPVHAAGIVGEVCLAAVTNTTCPATTPTISGPSPGTKSFFILKVMVNGSDALNSFDITLLTNSAVLIPTDVSLTGSVIVNTHELVKCVGGVNKIGSTACPPTDNANTLHYAVSGDITGRPISGLLFKANFTVAANSPNTPITFQTGCSNTSVSGGTCVTIGSGGNLSDQETVQTAKFSNQPYFELLPSSGSFTVSKGDQDLSGVVTIRSINGLGALPSPPATVNLAAAVTPVVANGPIFTLLPTTTAVSPGVDGLSGMNITVPRFAPPATYTLNITGTSGSLPLNFVTVQLIVPTPDLAVSVSPNHLLFNVTVSQNTTVTISSLGNFNGTVNLSPQSSNPGLVSATLVKTSLKLTSKGTNSTVLTVKATSAGAYTVNITATSGLLSHTASLAINVVDFKMHVPSTPLVVVNGSSSHEPIDVDATGIYNVTVSVTGTFVELVSKDTLSGPSTGLNVTCSPNKLILVSTNGTSGIVIGTQRTNCNVKGLAVGNYIVSVTAMSGSQNRTSAHAVAFSVTVVAPGFSIVVPASVTSVPVGSSSTFTVKIAGNLGITDDISVGLGITSSNLTPLPTLSQNVTVVHLTSSKVNASVSVTITTGSSTPAGFYTLTITGSGVRSTPTLVQATMLLVVVAISSPHDLAVYSVTPSTTSTTVGSDITIQIEVQNLGRLPENATILGIVGDQTIGNKNATLAPGQNVNVTITWHTTGFAPGAYMIGGKVLAVPGETILSNNLLRSATPVTLTSTNTSVFQSGYILPIAIIGVVIVAAIGLGLYFLPRRKTKTV